MAYYLAYLKHNDPRVRRHEHFNVWGYSAETIISHIFQGVSGLRTSVGLKLNWRQYPKNFLQLGRYCHSSGLGIERLDDIAEPIKVIFIAVHCGCISLLFLVFGFPKPAIDATIIGYQHCLMLDYPMSPLHAPASDGTDPNQRFYAISDLPLTV